MTYTRLELPCLVFENEQEAKKVSTKIVQTALERILGMAPGNCHMDAHLIVDSKQEFTYGSVNVSCKIRAFHGFFPEGKIGYSGLLIIENLTELKKQEIEAAHQMIIGEYIITNGLAYLKEKLK